MQPGFRIAVRLAVMDKANELGLSWRERRELRSKVMDEAEMDKAMLAYADAPREFMVLRDGVVPVAFGDGSLLKQIFAWISSPEGQAFIKFIISLFIGAMVI